ncbi:MAG: hypothetical protein ACI4EV_06720 [Lachnospiraceae bacterium]
MSIRPIDIAVIQRSQDVSQVRQNEINKPMTDQMNGQQMIQKDARTHAETVSGKDRPDNQAGDPDARQKGRGQQYDEEEKKRIEKMRGKVVLKNKGGIDIKI